MSSVQHITQGVQFETEEDAWQKFDAIVKANKAFASHSEVCGHYIQPRPDTEDKQPRIDRILIPLKPAIDAGWVYGAIGIEGKRSNHNAGHLVLQAMDYSRAAFELETGVPGLLLMCRWIFVFPFVREIGTVESLMVQSRIGYANVFERSIKFCVSVTNALVIHEDGSLQIAKSLPMGRKRGSR